VKNALQTSFESQLGDCAVRDAVIESAFFRLKSIASALLRRETVRNILLIGTRQRTLSQTGGNRISARAMRQVLIDAARLREICPFKAFLGVGRGIKSHFMVI
jgi:hypothetical protein